jgi:hypothetical protein
MNAMTLPLSLRKGGNRKNWNLRFPQERRKSEKLELKISSAKEESEKLEAR